MSVMLQIDNVSRAFGGIVAVYNCSMNIEQGKITGLIGPNGSGKTTLFNLITGVYPPDQGSVSLRGERITGLRPSQLCHRGLSRTFQITRLFWELSVLENMIVPVRQVGLRPLFGASIHSHEASRAMELLRRVGLEHMANQPARKLSFGQQKLLEFAAILMSDPDAILLDEPAGGVNPTMIRFMMELITELNAQQGITFLIVEHNMGVVMELCQHVVVLNFGEKIAEGTPVQVQANPLVLDAYLGN